MGQLGTFTKEIILLTSPTDCKVVRQGTKQMLYQQGHILSAVELHKEWTAYEMIAHLTDCFGSKIPEGARYVELF